MLRRPSDLFSNHTKLLVVSATAALAAGYFAPGYFARGYFALGRSDQSGEVAGTQQLTVDVPTLEFLPSRQSEAPSAKARVFAVEGQAEPEVQSASPEQSGRLKIRPSESGVDAGPPLPETGKQLFAASRSDPTCFPSASAVRQNHPGQWPSWTLRAPGHEGTKCWYSTSRTIIGDEAASAKALRSRIEPSVWLRRHRCRWRCAWDIKPAGSGIDAGPPLPESGKQLFAVSGHDATCFPSASAVRQNNPGGWPFWTLRAPGHDGTKCWYAVTQTTADDHSSEMVSRKEAAGTTEKLGSPTALFGVQ